MQLATERSSNWRANVIRRQRAERTHPAVTRIAYRPDLHEIAATVSLRPRDSARDVGAVLELGTHQRAVLLEALHQRERTRSLAGVLTMLAAVASIAILLGAGQATSGWWAAPILAFVAGLKLQLAAWKHHRALEALRRQVVDVDLERIEDPGPATNKSRDGVSR